MWNLYRLRGKDEFSKVIKQGKKMVNPSFLFFFQANNLNNCRFGISVPRRLIKKASQRNYYKRQIKCILTIFLKTNTNHCPSKAQHYNLLIIIRSSFLSTDFVNKKKALLSMLIELSKVNKNKKPIIYNNE